MDKKKISILVAVILLLVIVVVLCVSAQKGASNDNPNANNNENNIVQNNNNETNNSNNSDQQEEPELPTTKIEGTKTLDNLVFSDIKIVEEATNQNMLVATVENNGTENIMDGVVLNIELFNQNGESIGIVGGTLPFVAADSIAEMRVPIAVNVMHTADVTFSYANNS